LALRLVHLVHGQAAGQFGPEVIALMSCAARPFVHRRHRGQSLVEFAIAAPVLILLVMGLLDLSRAFYYAVNIQGAAREGARHGAWFDTATRSNLYLDDADIMLAVDQSMAGSGFDGTTLPLPVQVKTAGCLIPTDGNTFNNKPYPAAADPPSTGQVYVYICYTRPGGGFQTGTMPAHPVDNSWRLGDVNVAIIMNFRLVTPLIQNLFGNGLPLVYNEHFTIQGQP
jgi:Flp pilus assembly protein TadG